MGFDKSEKYHGGLGVSGAVVTAKTKLVKHGGGVGAC